MSSHCSKIFVRTLCWWDLYILHLCAKGPTLPWLDHSIFARRTVWWLLWSVLRWWGPPQARSILTRRPAPDGQWAVRMVGTRWLQHMRKKEGCWQATVGWEAKGCNVDPKGFEKGWRWLEGVLFCEAVKRIEKNWVAWTLRKQWRFLYKDR